MSDIDGHIELERSIDSIVIGVRHRTDLGDLGPLMHSIRERGLLQPVTITPEGLLVCGRRRLEAAKRLGLRTLRVWVRSGISDELSRLLAQRDENELRKPLTPLEEASVFAELKSLLSEDAARRQHSSRFGSHGDFGGESGAADSAAPRRGKGDTRRQAAELLSGRAGYGRLEQINFIRWIASDASGPAAIRTMAAGALKSIEGGEDVYPLFQRVKALTELASDGNSQQSSEPVDLERLAAEALARVKEKRARGGGRIRSPQRNNEPTRRSARAFVLTWTDLDGWSAHYDAEEVGVKLEDRDWETFERVLRETATFAEIARAARERSGEPASA